MVEYQIELKDTSYFQLFQLYHTVFFIMAGVCSPAHINTDELAAYSWKHWNLYDSSNQ